MIISDLLTLAPVVTGTIVLLTTSERWGIWSAIVGIFVSFITGAVILYRDKKERDARFIIEIPVKIKTEDIK